MPFSPFKSLLLLLLAVLMMGILNISFEIVHTLCFPLDLQYALLPILLCSVYSYVASLFWPFSKYNYLYDCHESNWDYFFIIWDGNSLAILFDTNCPVKLAQTPFSPPTKSSALPLHAHLYYIALSKRSDAANQQGNIHWREREWRRNKKSGKINKRVRKRNEWS